MKRSTPWTCALLLIATLAACAGEGELDVDGDVERRDPNAPIAELDRAGPQAGPGGLAGGDEGGFDDHCNDEVEPEDRVFERALCLCGDLGDVGQGLRTRSYSGHFGQHEGHGHVGVNGTVDVIGYANVEGNLDVAGNVQGIGKLTSEGDLRTGGNFGGLGSYAVLGDAEVNGNLEGIGAIKILGKLALNGQQNTLGVVDSGEFVGGYAHPAGYQPCGCEPGQIIDVPAEVARRRAQNNNAALPTGGIGFRDVTLRTGDYHFESADALLGASKLTIEGRVAIFVEGDMDAIGNTIIDLSEGSELALWVSGSVRTIGNLRFANDEDARARAFKLYVGGNEAAVLNVGNARFYGAIYAPTADLGFVGNLQVFGAVFANNLRGAGNLDIFYDTDIVVPDDCIDDAPEPAPDTNCKDDSNCGDGEVCDELTHDCVDEGDCENDGDCIGSDRCIDGVCVVL